MTKKKSKKTSQVANYLNYKNDNSHSNNISDVLHIIKVFHQDLLFKDKLNSSVLSSIQKDLDRLHGLEKEILYMNRQVNGIQENKTKICKLKKILKISSSFLTLMIITLVVFTLVLVIISMNKVIT
jgi:hypothetical protein